MTNSSQYKHLETEQKWARIWAKDRLFYAIPQNPKQKFYILDTFVYPSASGVTVGAIKSFGGTDLIARYKRMKGYSVFYPTGWDSFGLPAENYAIKNNKHPNEIITKAIAHYKEQFKKIGLSYTWDSELNTADPKYYKWTQWLFIEMYKRGLAYQKKTKINYCPSCLTVISDEQVVNDNECERCGTKIIRKNKKQWFFSITKYAERLFYEANNLKWDKKYINLHKAWIGSEVDGKFIPRIHDWCVSRQRYWATPIPVVYLPDGSVKPVDEKYLPLKLPMDVNFLPTGKSPIEDSKEYVQLAEKIYGKGARFETDTLDTFVSSSWYFLRFIDPKYSEAYPRKLANKWCPVDQYAGTTEHITAHLVYARFIAKVLFDAKLINFDEPFPLYTPVGLLVDKSGRKFSKRLGNAPPTDDLIVKYGADILRVSCYFITPYADISRWSEESVKGVIRFRDRMWRVFSEKVINANSTPTSISERIKALKDEVETEIVKMQFNVAVSKLMIFIREIDTDNSYTEADWSNFCKIVAPFMPYIAEEMWQLCGNRGSVHKAVW